MKISKKSNLDIIKIDGEEMSLPIDGKFDAKKYEKLKPMLTGEYTRCKKLSHRDEDFIQTMREILGDGIKPYIFRFGEYLDDKREELKNQYT